MVFRDVRKQLLPRIVQQSYAEAKAAFDRKELEAAAIGFDRVLLLLNDPDLPVSSGTADLRMLADGFRDSARWLPHPRRSRRAGRRRAFLQVPNPRRRRVRHVRTVRTTPT